MYFRRSECAEEKKCKFAILIAQGLFDIIRQNVRSIDITKSIKNALILAKELYVCSILVQQVAQCCSLLSPAAAATAAATAAAATPAAGQTAPVAAAPAPSIVGACLLAVAPLYCIQALQPMGGLVSNIACD
jgi:hypothetical protein